MNLRERIADFISGGEYSRAVLIAGEAAILMVDRHNLAAKRESDQAERGEHGDAADQPGA